MKLLVFPTLMILRFYDSLPSADKGPCSYASIKFACFATNIMVVCVQSGIPHFHSWASCFPASKQGLLLYTHNPSLLSLTIVSLVQSTLLGSLDWGLILVTPTSLMSSQICLGCPLCPGCRWYLEAWASVLTSDTLFCYWCNKIHGETSPW